MNIVLTGVTGIIGREVLTELIIQHLKDQMTGKIICLVRGNRSFSALNRIQNILNNIMDELGIGQQKIANLVIGIDTSKDKPRSFESLIEYLNKEKIKEVNVLHLASTTNLSPLAQTEDEIYRDSYLPTIDLLTTLLPYAKQYSFVSTAFSCGHQEGLIPNNFLNMNISKNRNYYERYKLMAERQVKEICEKNSIQWQIFRSSIVSGRLIRKPYYYTPKFNVFYAWTGFFASLKANKINCEGIRIHANPLSGMNIISSDYVAQTIVRGFNSKHVTELNITHSQNFENTLLIPSMLQSVGIKNFEYVDQIPDKNISLAEKLYYKTAGSQFSPYLYTDVHQYDSEEIRKIMHDVKEPDIKNSFNDILQYAVEREFKSELI